MKHLEDSKLYAEKKAKNYLNELTELGSLEGGAIEGGHYYLLCHEKYNDNLCDACYDYCLLN